MKATYVTVWDSGLEIRTECAYDPQTLNVSNIESVDIEVGDDTLDREYVELPDGTIIDTFNDEDNGRTIADGTMDEADDNLRLYPPHELLMQEADKYDILVEIVNTGNDFDGPQLANDYWDCACSKNFIHKKGEGFKKYEKLYPDQEVSPLFEVDYCPQCGTDESEQPDSCVDEVLVQVFKSQPIIEWYAQQENKKGE